MTGASRRRSDRADIPDLQVELASRALAACPEPGDRGLGRGRRADHPGGGGGGGGVGRRMEMARRWVKMARRMDQEGVGSLS